MVGKITFFVFLVTICNRVSWATPNKIPQFLKFKGELSSTQKKLFDSYGILAINYTDSHAEVVLKHLDHILTRALPKNFISRVPSFKYLLAMDGHDSEIDAAAYHRDLKAISIGGESSYDSQRNLDETIFRTLAHEIGHAFIFDQMTPKELFKISCNFLYRSSQCKLIKKVDFYSPFFFKRMIFNMKEYPRFNIVSDYALTNLHEWFAESFSAFILLKLYAPSRNKAKRSRKSFNLSNQFVSWFELKLKSI